MLKIGEFSKLAQVSVKALRYYGKLGLLKPAWIDRFTGYRYYALEQLPRLNRILALKDLGFSLEQIQLLLEGDVPSSELRGMLRLKHAELQRSIQAEQARLARVEARLQQIEHEGHLPAYDVVLKPVKAQRVVGIRDTIATYENVPVLFDELRAYLQAHDVAPDSVYPCFSIYYDTEYREQCVDVEVLGPIARRLPHTPKVAVRTLPSVETMACVIHQGDYATLSDAYGSLTGWVEANGYRITGPNREVYLQGGYLGQPPTSQASEVTYDPFEPDYGRAKAAPSMDTSEQLVIEIQFPVERVASIYMIAQKEKSMEPKIVTKPGFTVVGMLYRGKNETNEIPQMWDKFGPRMEEVEHRVGLNAYGVCGHVMEEDGTFDYVAGVEVDSTEDIPEGMVSWDVPERTYAVFPCTLKTIGEAYTFAFQTWLPQSNYKRAPSPDFELYDETFDPQDPELYIYIPIEASS